MDIHDWIMDIHDWIMNIHNWIMDVHNWILDIYNGWILWIAMYEQWIFMIVCVYTKVEVLFAFGFP